MVRIKRGVQAHQRHKKVLAQAKGYYGARSRVFRVAKQSVIKALQYAYRDRKTKKRHFRSLWITRINGALREHGLNYSVFMHQVKAHNIELNRKMLAELAMFNHDAFISIVKQVSIPLALS
jgi:large subunit ribosomal protein L20